MVDWLSVTPIIIAIIAILATIWATRQWGNRRARLEFVNYSIPLFPYNTYKGLLRVTFRDIPVKNPYLVIINLRNIGPRDIASTAFDEDQPISIRFNQTFYGLTNPQGGVQTESPPIGSPANEAVVQVKPGLLKRGEVWSFTAILSGPVKVSINAPLIDTDLIQKKQIQILHYWGFD